MHNAPIGYPLDIHLKKGISAAEAIKLLQEHDCLAFPQLKSGLFPAANFDSFEKDETGMTNAWLRDTSCIGLILLDTNRDVAIEAVKGILSCLDAIRQSFENSIESGQAPVTDGSRPPVRFTGEDSVPLYDWANAQNDALGYALQFIGKVAKLDVIDVDRGLINVLVSYLETVRYWEDADSGHWEEIKKVNASSIGTVVAGLRAIRSVTADETKITALIERGNEALNAILPFESKTPRYERAYDSALVFLVEPQSVVSDEMAEKIIIQTEQNLMGEHGFRRYENDSYWGPDYREHFQVGSRTEDFSKPENMALRNRYLTPGNEAQWTLIDPLMAIYYARQYQKQAKPEDARQAKRFIARSLKSIVTHEKEGVIVWRIPELFFLEDGMWVPNDHLGLLWGQANLLQGLLVYQEVFGDAKIIMTEAV